MTLRSTLFASSASLAFVLAVAACGSKPPKSTTTTRVQSSTTNEAGDKTSTDTKETTVEQRDGSHTVHSTKTTDTSVPPGK